MKKQYDYWLIVWTGKDGEEVHQPLPFQVGGHPKAYCEEILKSEWTSGKGGELKDLYQSYELYRLDFTNSNGEIA